MVRVCFVCFFFFPRQALAKLKKIPDTIKAIMERLEPELKQIVKRSTTQIADHAYQRGENLAQESQPRYSRRTEKVQRGRKALLEPPDEQGLLGLSRETGKTGI